MSRLAVFPSCSMLTLIMQPTICSSGRSQPPEPGSFGVIGARLWQLGFPVLPCWDSLC